MTEQPLPNIDVDTMAADTTTFLLDVRESVEWQAGHVERAVTLPHVDLGHRPLVATSTTRQRPGG